MNKCLGCGILLQDKDPNALGYIRCVNQEMCERCFRLKHYGQYKKVTLSNLEYQQIIDTIPSHSLVVYISDILSLSKIPYSKFKKVLFVITKRDIFPKSVKDDKLIKYVYKQNPNLLDVVVVSSQNNYNMDKFYLMLKKYANHQDIYFIGATNSGKSTLLNKLIQDYKEEKNTQVTVSMYPATTLDKVPISFENFTIIDTPGLIEEGNIINYLEKDVLKKIIPKKEIKPKSCQIKGCGSVVIGNLVRIDYETTMNNSMVIYTSNLIDIRFVSNKKDFLKNLSSTKFELSKKSDIVIPGLGFIKFVNPIKVTIYTLNKVTPYTRDNLI